MRRQAGSLAILAVTLAVTLCVAQTKGGGTGTGTGSGSGKSGAPSGTPTGGGHKGGGHNFGPGNGVGNITLPPGWGMAPQLGNGIALQPMPAVQPLPMVIQPLVGFPQNTQTPIFGNQRVRSRTVFVPVPVAVPYGYGYSATPFYSGSPFGPGAPQPADNVVYVDPNTSSGSGNGPGIWAGSQPQAPPPQVITPQPSQPPVTVNNYIYTVAPPPKTEEGSKPITLLVFKDHSIYAVSDYWQEGTRVFYVTTYGSKDSVAVEQLDMEFTIKLNNERNVTFELKPKS